MKKRNHPDCKNIIADKPVEDAFARIKSKAEQVKSTITEGKYKIVSACYGRIEHILFVYPKLSADTCEPIHEDLVAELIVALRKKNPNLRITIVANDERKINKLNTNLKNNKGSAVIKDSIIISNLFDAWDNVRELKQTLEWALIGDAQKKRVFRYFNRLVNPNVLTTSLPLTFWVQDPFLVLNSLTPKNNDKILLLEPDYFLPTGRLIANHLKNKMGAHFIHFEKFGFRFEGGNILAGKDFALVGANTVDRIKKKIGGNNWKNAVSEYLVGIPENEIYEIRSSPYNSTITGKMNGLAFMGSSVLEGEQPMFHIDMFIALAGKNENGEEVIMIGDPVSVYNEHDDILKAVAGKISEVKTSLTSQGFDVRPVPMPFTYMHVAKEQEPKWYFATYNNCLVQIVNEKDKTVWIPQFAFDDWKDELEEYEKTIRCKWNLLGFEVNFIHEFHLCAQYRGALHCMVKCLKRT
ncbi:MAG: hypothetical protein AAFZ15_00195 [Bacteroidota bacterium]